MILHSCSFHSGLDNQAKLGRVQMRTGSRLFRGWRALRQQPHSLQAAAGDRWCRSSSSFCVCASQGGGRGKGRPKPEESIYKNTVNLPETSFGMRANAKQREPQIQQLWQDEKVYESLLDSNTGGTFTLHDGPPYANGDLHIGHALNKILKDIINKYQLLQGRRVRYIPGWDCHGLPIELKVLTAMPEEARLNLTPLKLRRKARDFALKTVDAQRTAFKRYGVWGEWENPYLTLRPSYEAAQLRVFAKMVANGHIYRGRKPVHWSPSSRTALAEAELEYPEGHTSHSIYVAMPLTSSGDNEVQQQLKGAALAIWTTTPWSMPANVAVAVHPRLKYSLVEVEGEAASGWVSKRLVVAEELVEKLSEKLGVALKPLASFMGEQLEHCRYQHPMEAYGREGIVVLADYVTTESGTGLVHSAPGHGQDDFQVGQRYGLPVIAPVDDAGVFTEEAGPVAGLDAMTDGSKKVMDLLRDAGVMLKLERYQHKYPYDWRTKQPTMLRATEQWFASVEGFRAAAMQAVDQVQWVPQSARNRIAGMVEGRSDWCISRQRKWGTPIPCFFNTTTGEALMTPEIIEHVAGVLESGGGGDAWWTKPLEELLPESLRDQADSLRKGEDTMDVWMDSGVSWHILEQEQDLGLPADLYLEGSDQSRGWFQSSLLTCVAATGHAPYRQVLTHGFVLDERGIKMSKSIGNVVDPRGVIEGGKDQKKEPAFGADVLRLWVSSVDYTNDVLIGGNILSQVAEVYRKMRLTLRYMLGNLAGFEASKAVPYAELPRIDRYILGRFANLLDESKSAYDSFSFYRIYQALQRFTVSDLSNLYIDVAKDRLYVRGRDSLDRRSAQTVLAAMLQGLMPLLAPILPHTAEDAFQALPLPSSHKSIFQAGWQKGESDWRLPAEEHRFWKSVLGIRSEVNGVLEEARQGKLIGASLEARVLLHVADSKLRQQLASLDRSVNGADPLRYIFITSQAELVDEAGAASAADYSRSVDIEGVGKVTLGVAHAQGQKCSRCWNFSSAVGEDHLHPELCERCSPVIRDMGDLAPQPLQTA
ncbi:hypothetical protein WJX74_003674 [Apatococcus lobatus]|uniref:isoleucine--tRNA ligase n=1 Tax=Apatococcus lobatus TaxID=904363 RepID=A0AAW1QLD9_9CHLO